MLLGFYFYFFGFFVFEKEPYTEINGIVEGTDAYCSPAGLNEAQLSNFK